ncbi:tRNA-splicing endonuclease subunit sen54 N-term [Phytophthora infestans]|uniref:tRNA-splicing endonuclease subunit sen54 N-term n=1 Tax=Phytophthora infestans TaxID=4787 RepID=A0A833WIZ9_PHYIN|nr:tRNA-splicing endonuclease subunit sen54 N-term [Phytophthora infestans]
MARPSKDVSVGEYDKVTGLTHITNQRGRLLFNMGASVKKRQRRVPAADASPTLLTTTGTFTGLSLYPEEANYLVQRGALIVYHMTHGSEEANELSVAGFTAILLNDTRVSLACVEVYAFLKDQKLHPRRCLEPLTAATSSDDGRSIPRHLNDGEHCDVAFDVWKTVTVGNDAVELALPTPKKQKSRKKLALVFRAAVCRFGDVPPSPRSLRRVIERSKSRELDGDGSNSACQVPVKLAVVHHYQSVLIFELGALLVTST